MKTLILGPIDYPTATKDLAFINYGQDVYSVYYLLDTMNKGDNTHVQQVALSLILTTFFTQKEYEAFDIFFGPMNKKFKFDRVIVYQDLILSAQEAVLLDAMREFPNIIYMSTDATHTVANIVEAIKLAKS